MAKKNLNILIFNRWVGFNNGGNETHIKELAYFLAKKGHKVSILTTGNQAITYLKPLLYKTYKVSSPQTYYAYKGSGFVSTLQSLWFLLKSFLKITKIVLIDRERIDVLSVHFSLEAFLARFVRLVYGIPYILILVGDTDFELLEGKYADITVQISNFMADESLPFGYRPRVIPKGVDRERFNTKIPRDERKKLLKNPLEEKIVLAVCRLDPRKNLETLVKASCMTKKTNPEIKYVIVGGGVEEIKLKELVKKENLEETVIFTGMIPSESHRLPKLFRAADIFALPTLYEGFGFVFSEAMACGLPIISTNTSAVPEVIAGTGIMIPPKNPKILAQKIIYVLKNEKIRKEMIEKSKKRVEKWYWNVLINKYEEAYIEASNADLSIRNRFRKFGESLTTLGFLINKTLKFAGNPSKLSWGPQKEKPLHKTKNAGKIG